jgi:hypothetical protein
LRSPKSRQRRQTHLLANCDARASAPSAWLSIKSEHQQMSSMTFHAGPPRAWIACLRGVTSLDRTERGSFTLLHKCLKCDITAASENSALIAFEIVQCGGIPSRPGGRSHLTRTNRCTATPHGDAVRTAVRPAEVDRLARLRRGFVEPGNPRRRGNHRV